ncbi:FAS1 domain-containing protein [Imleria badia]|nr:FAS1 domain-containing protein [Imleria badia]
MRLAKLLTLAFGCSASALPVATLPWFGQITFDGLVEYLGYMSNLAEDGTIYQVLKNDRQYSRLVKAIDLSENVVGLLSDPSKSITFFALPNSKLPRHHKPHRGDRRHDESLVHCLADSLSDVSHDLGDLVQRAEELEKEPESRDKEKRKETLARIVQKIIAYHILPELYGTADLIQNSTYATNLTLNDGSMDSKPQRLSFLSTSIPPRLRINMLVEVTKRDIKAKNGVIHQISHALLPPPSIFQETFFVPEVFSFFTSAIQRVGLTGVIDRWQCSKDDGHNVSFLGATATTVFAPTSGAFERLPKKLRSYLFSPFGRKALKKLLEYHIVPNSVLYTDYFHNSTSSDVKEFSHCFKDALETQFEVPVPALVDGHVEDPVLTRNTIPFTELVYEYNATLPTLLEDHYLRVHVARYKSNLIPRCPRYFTSFKVNGRHVGPFDIPARNGALHVVSTILDPRKGRDHQANNGGDEAAWEDWEEWLHRWAMEN